MATENEKMCTSNAVELIEQGCAHRIDRQQFSSELSQLKTALEVKTRCDAIFQAIQKRIQITEDPTEKFALIQLGKVITTAQRFLELGTQAGREQAVNDSGLKQYVQSDNPSRYLLDLLNATKQ